MITRYIFDICLPNMSTTLEIEIIGGKVGGIGPNCMSIMSIE